tara:strand:- start:193 stop:618 length:426 start_codon:yes stop_codon:yes gene_type:complete
MSVNKPEDVISLSNKYKNKIYVSLDIKNNFVMVKGWKEKSDLLIEDVLKLYNDSFIKGYVITDIKNDGMLSGLNFDFINETLIEVNKMKDNKKIILAGGLTNYNDLVKLKQLNQKNIEGIISGKSFYVGNIDLVKAQKILD